MMEKHIDFITSIFKRNLFLATLFISGDGKLIIAQWPNSPLWIAIAFSFISAVTNGQVHRAASLIEMLALLYWAFLEFKEGENVFRKILGGVVGILEFISLVKIH